MRLATAGKHGLDRFMQQLVTSETEGNLENAKGFAREVLAPERGILGHLSNTPQLGGLEQLTGEGISRLDYVARMVSKLLEIKEDFRGCGLSSNRSELSFRGRRLTGLEICQSFVILVNYGHQFATFSTERAFFYELLTKPSEADAFLDEIAPRLRTVAMRLLEARDISGFHRVLSSWRIAQDADPEFRETASGVLALLLAPETSYHRRLAFLVGRVRQYVLCELHDMLGHIPGALGHSNSPSVSLSAVLDPNSLLGEIHGAPPTPTASFLESLESFQREVFFSSPSVAQLVLRHLREYHRWSEHNRCLTVSEKAARLWTKPTDWPTNLNNSEASGHFVRLDLWGPTREWFDAVSALRAAQQRWSGTSFLVTPTQRGLYCDLYRNGMLEPREVASVAQFLVPHAERSRSAGPELQGRAKEVWRSGATFLRRCFSSVFSEGHDVTIEAAAATHDHIGFAVFSGAHADLAWVVSRFANICTDPCRKRELDSAARWVIDNAKAATHAGALAPRAVAGFLAKVVIVDPHRGTEEAELDWVQADFFDDTVVWHVLELKHGTAVGRGTGQLQRVATFLREHESASAHVSQQFIKGAKASHLTFSTRQR